MIFVTVGAQMPFDRLIDTVDTWAARTGRHDVFAQIGRSALTPDHIESTPFLDPIEFRQRLFSADVVITHAGMGTILSALELEKPIVVMPRRGELAETRNDHQLGTARRFAESHGLAVAWTEQDLAQQLEHLDTIPIPMRVSSHASTELLDHLRQFIRGENVALPRPRLVPAPPGTAQRPVIDTPDRKAA